MTSEERLARQEWRENVMPLDLLPTQTREAIQHAVAQPTKPPRYLYFGGDSPRTVAAIDSRAWWEWHWQRGLHPGETPHRRRLPPELRAYVIARDGLTCGICTQPVDPDDVHIDHIHPVARGGTDDPDNLQVAHSLCNLRKGDRT